MTTNEHSIELFVKYDIYYSCLSEDITRIHNSFRTIREFTPDQGVDYASYVIQSMKLPHRNTNNGDPTVFNYSLYALDVTHWEQTQWKKVNSALTNVEGLLEDFQFDHFVCWLNTHNQHSKSIKYRRGEPVLQGLLPEHIWMILGNSQGMNIAGPQQIDLALLSLQVGLGSDYDSEKYCIKVGESRWISPILLNHLSQYPGFQTAPEDWKAVDSLSASAKFDYTKHRAAIFWDIQIDTQDQSHCNDRGSQAYLQYLQMNRETKGIAWFYDPKTQTVKEYYLPEMIFGSEEK